MDLLKDILYIVGIYCIGVVGFIVWFRLTKNKPDKRG